MPDTSIVDSHTRARTFLDTSARLPERRLARLLLDDGGIDDACAVLETLAAYRNPDGGFGWALEPDVRCPDSQPLAADFALEILDLVLRSPVGRDTRVLAGARDLAEPLLPYLASVAVDGGLPIVLPSVAAHPRAAHWGDGVFPPALNPTAGITARLLDLGFESRWLTEAASFCRREIDALTPERPLDAHSATGVLRFLTAWPDRAWADGRVRAVTDSFDRMPLLQLYPGVGYGLTPLDLAPHPGDPLRSAFPDDAIPAHLDELAAAQQQDGGWPLGWTPPGPAAEQEWRGVVTVRALHVLKLNER
ncbi:hypothetical protein SAMN05216266_11648 [Amycolatopsis marina]|uniref:Prenyltransferase and squalene oxidase repeat-containing protein n=1 Tax=Amycolatopsis marina TaxID=490629 RepID=A0A1I1BS48_9PSEU|nr:hypothetical protein [Amycolatopsis marina]SFB52506.1 hypothetical protein SAMN05216266_11648 [Amycolatopsis marina]